MRVGDIEVGKCIGESSKIRIYLGTTKDMKPVILKIAKTFEDGKALAEEAGEFNILHSFSRQVAEFEANRNGNSAHYDWLFARLLSSRMEPTQGDRRINVFSIPDVDLSELIPLSKLYDDVEIDVRTSIWILGRLLKFYMFFELLAVEKEEFVARYPIFSPDDYLIAPEKHRLVYYNFSGDMTDVVAFDYVKAVAEFVSSWVIHREDPLEQEYLELLRDLSRFGRETFERAHRELYKLVKKNWGIKYYPFTYCKRGTVVWKKIKED